MSAESPADEAKLRRSAGAFVLMMGTVSLFGDMTYEGARSLTGPYLQLLGTSAVAVGFAVGLGEFVGYGLRLVTGWLGERTRAYWAFVVLGYTLNLIAVPGLAFVGSWEAAVALIWLERLGKAIRSPARSTLVSHAASRIGTGKGFGIEEAMDQIGAVSGPLLATLAIWLAKGQPGIERYQDAFKWLAGPAVATVFLVLLARGKFPKPESFEQPRQLRHFGHLYVWYVAAAALLGFGFADWALVAFHAAKTQLVDLTWLPALYSLAMGVDAIAALGFGWLFDRYGLSTLAIAAALSAAFAPFAFLIPEGWSLVFGAMLWAVGMGAQESIFKAAIAELVPKEQRSRAYGVFFALFGLTWWLGSTTLGFLYSRSLPLMVGVSVGAQLAAVPLFLFVARKVSQAKAAA